MRANLQLAPMAIGRIDMQYRRVECVPPATMVVFVGKSGASFPKCFAPAISAVDLFVAV